MERQQINRICRTTILVLCCIALLAVVCGYVSAIASGQVQPDRDEGALAHIFQLSVGLLAPVGLAFLFTADRGQPRRTARLLAAPMMVLALAFLALYFLEHQFLKIAGS